MSTEKTSIGFRPKRQWKPKRRDRNTQRRMKRKQWWRRNRNKLKMQRKRRYKQLRNNPLFKQWRKKRYKERNKRRQRVAHESECLDPTVPEIWVVFRDQAVDLDLGYVCDYDADEEEILIFDVDENIFKTVSIEDFLTYSEFLTDEDWEGFEALMDRYYEEDGEMLLDEKTQSQLAGALYDFVSWTEKSGITDLNQALERWLWENALDKVTPEENWAGLPDEITLADIFTNRTPAKVVAATQSFVRYASTHENRLSQNLLKWSIKTGLSLANPTWSKG